MFAIIAVVLAVVSTALSIALQPRQIPPPAAGIGDLQAPIAEEGRPIPVVFGTVLLRAPNVVWYGDLTTEPVKFSGGK